MAQRVFTFHSPADVKQTITLIEDVVSHLNGKVKTSGNVIKAQWWANNTTLFPHKFTFYVGKEMVRVVTSDLNTAWYKTIKWEFGIYNSVLKLWREFIRLLNRRYYKLDFSLESERFYIVSAKIMSDGIEQVTTSTSKTKPSIAGAMVGGALFGDVGAIIGSGRSKTRTTGTTRSVFSDKVLVTVRYSNGLILEGKISKKSQVYNSIVAGVCETE